jgi:phosphodiesterase/alkaline phosphatase D-like protein
MWNHPYRPEGNAIDYNFRWGPLHFFMTDGRFHSHREKWILGDAQLDRLIRGLRESDAPVKIIVLGSQLIGWSKASFLNSAKNERERLLTAIANDVRGRVLVFSGDVHYSECQPFPLHSQMPALVEVTSSALRVGDHGKPVNPLDSNRLWVAFKESFAIVEVDVTGTSSASGVTGSVRIEAFDDNGEVLRNILPFTDGECRTVWNLTTGELS